MQQLFDFLTELAANNNREWFNANKTRYLAIRSMWTARIGELIAAMALWDPALRNVDPADCLYRIYRDTRFSSDKTPYKTYFSALISPRGRHTDRGSYYIHVGVDETALYGGVWCPPPQMLRKLRKAIIDNIDEFRAILADPALSSTFPDWWGRRLKTAPKGFDRNHPDIDLLRLTEFGRYCNLPRSFFLSPDWPAEAAAMFRTLKPLVDFLNYSIDEDI